MTTNNERFTAISNVRIFLEELLNTKRVPKKVKSRAGYLLRHYPESWWVKQRQETDDEKYEKWTNADKGAKP
jgi:hypothetical protein